MKIVGLVTARAGSKGAPGKNMRAIGGRSLIQWKIDAARPVCSEIWISSDSDDMLAEGEKHGARTIKRPAYLATDEAISADVIRHAQYIMGDVGDYVILLEPSAPFTTMHQYQRAVAWTSDHNTDLIVGVKPATPTIFVGTIGHHGEIDDLAGCIATSASNRQQHAQHVTPSGALYMFKWNLPFDVGSIYGGDRNYALLQDRWTGHEIDTMDDWELAVWAHETGRVA